MFYGNYNNSIDAKNRMTIPHKFRYSLGIRCMLTKGIDECIYIYTLDEWEQFVAKISQLPTTDPNVRNFVRHFCGNAEECEVDKQGRVTIPVHLREYAKVEKELRTIGTGTKIEVWGKEYYEDNAGIPELDGADIAESMQKYDI